MELERLFKIIEEMREKASVETVFGPPQVVGEKTIIPIAQVSYGFGLGFGQGTAVSEGEEEAAPTTGEGGGGGGGVSAKPVAVLEVTPERTVIRPVIDEGKIAVAGILLSAWAIFWVARTLNRLFGRR